MKLQEDPISTQVRASVLSNQRVTSAHSRRGGAQNGVDHQRTVPPPAGTEHRRAGSESDKQNGDQNQLDFAGNIYLFYGDETGLDLLYGNDREEAASLHYDQSTFEQSKRSATTMKKTDLISQTLCNQEQETQHVCSAIRKPSFASPNWKTFAMHGKRH